MPAKFIPFWNHEFKGKIIDALKQGKTFGQIKVTLKISQVQLDKNRTADPKFAKACFDAKREADNEHVRLKFKIENLSTELEMAKKQLAEYAEYAELLRWRITEQEPPTESGHYEVLWPNQKGGYGIELWMPNEFINRDENEQPPYWRHIIDNEPDYENLP